MSLIIREVESKTILISHLIPIMIATITPPPPKTSIGEDVEESEILCPASGNVKWYSCYGKQYRGFSKN